MTQTFANGRLPKFRNAFKSRYRAVFTNRKVWERKFELILYFLQSHVAFHTSFVNKANLIPF